ncbi:Mechanosensitive ion channel protein 10 [Platanthera guangdongensis]|uniref:Mechanosensitive ion channel protein 10 n=1 Tax=Platanthera guangdongensis TaxID=2320717 RepID=A0ABR2LQU3_9ASPA
MGTRSSEPSDFKEVVVHVTPPSSKASSVTAPVAAAAPAKSRPAPALPASKPKSRFIELNFPPRPGILKKSNSIPAAVFPEPSSDSSDDDDHPISDKFIPDCHRRNTTRRIGLRAIAEALALVPAAALLISTLAIKSLRPHELWRVKIWRWCVVLMSIFSGRLISGWLVWIAVFLIERHFLLQEKVLYFAYGLRKSVRGCVWLGLILLSWYLVLDPGKSDASPSFAVLRHISRGLVAVFIACTIWLVKIILVKVFASSFHVATFFDRMKESVFHHYVLESLSGDPIDRVGEKIGGSGMGERNRRVISASKSMATTGKVDMERLRRLSRVGVSARSVRRLVAHVMRKGLTTVSKEMDQLGKQRETEIGDELEAMASAQRIFKNVAGPANKSVLPLTFFFSLKTKGVQKMDEQSMKNPFLLPQFICIKKAK